MSGLENSLQSALEDVEKDLRQADLSLDLVLFVLAGLFVAVCL